MPLERQGDLEIMYAQVQQRLLEWEALALIAQDDVDMKDMTEQTTWMNSAAKKSPTIEEHGLRNRRVMRKIIMSQGKEGQINASMN
jgi:hypothetical protein